MTREGLFGSVRLLIHHPGYEESHDRPKGCDRVVRLGGERFDHPGVLPVVQRVPTRCLFVVPRTASASDWSSPSLSSYLPSLPPLHPHRPVSAGAFALHPRLRSPLQRRPFANSRALAWLAHPSAASGRPVTSSTSTSAPTERFPRLQYVFLAVDARHETVRAIDDTPCN